jgi:hypothetical protein
LQLRRRRPGRSRQRPPVNRVPHASDRRQAQTIGELLDKLAQYETPPASPPRSNPPRPAIH